MSAIETALPALQAAAEGTTLLCLAGFFYVHLGYPLVMSGLALLAPRRARREPPEAELPRLSLIIAAYNEERCLADKLRNSLALDYPAGRLEIIVAADGSDDATADVARRFADQGVAALHEPERRGKSAAISRAAVQAKGDVLVFSDANAFYAPDALRRLAACFADPAVGGAGGRKTVLSTSGVGGSEGFYWKYESLLKRFESETGSTVTMVGEMMAVRRELFAPVPRGIINDDAWISCAVLKSGRSLLYEPAAVCRESACANTADEAVRRRRINAGRWQLLFRPSAWPWRSPFALFKLVSHKFLRLLLPFFMLGALGANLTLAAMDLTGAATVHGFFRATLALQVAAWLLALAGAAAERFGLGKSGWLRPPALAWYLTRSSLTPLDGLLRLLAGRQTSVWQMVARPTDPAAEAKPGGTPDAAPETASSGLATVADKPPSTPGSDVSLASEASVGAYGQTSPGLIAEAGLMPTTTRTAPAGSTASALARDAVADVGSTLATISGSGLPGPSAGS